MGILDIDASVCSLGGVLKSGEVSIARYSRPKRHNATLTLAGWSKQMALVCSPHDGGAVGGPGMGGSWVRLYTIMMVFSMVSKRFEAREATAVMPMRYHSGHYRRVMGLRVKEDVYVSNTQRL